MTAAFNTTSEATAAAAPARSYLFVPGDRSDRFDQALASGADVVILDLEDAVAAAGKARARTEISNWLRADRPVALRINDANTEWFDADLVLCAHEGVAAVLLPKAETSQQIAAVAAVLRAGAVVLPIIESALGMSRVQTIAAGARVQRLAFGTLDFRADMGLTSGDANLDDGEEIELAPYRASIALASRIAGLQAPIDGVTTRIDNAARVEADTRRAQRFGFGAKLCIHPKQIASVHRALAPSDKQIDWARRVLAAAKNSGGSAVQVDGRMVDRPVILQAEAVLARAARG